jgi:hypothetical protein
LPDAVLGPVATDPFSALAAPAPRMRIAVTLPM